MNVKFSAAQSAWLQHVTGEDNLQDSVDVFLRCMKYEGIATSDILDTINAIMKRVPRLPPGKGDE